MALNSLSSIFKGSLANGSLARGKFGRVVFLFAPILFAQSFFQNFPGGSLGEALQELYRPRALEVRNTRAAEFEEFRFRWVGTGFRYNQPLGHFAPFFVWDWNDGSFVNRGMCQERLLHFER